jgi:hypothetical protein
MSTVTQVKPAIENSTPVYKLRSYTLWYHFRTTKPQELHFELAGPLPMAIERGIVHCQRMNYKFIKVRPMIVDLDEREARRNDDREEF